jgi:SAM-dependent methyltransferase
MTVPDPTTRFTDRVAHYVKSRPGYPDALVEALRTEVGVVPGSIVADVGSGTGLSTAVVRRLGGEVYAVEPNAAMREAAETRFAGDPLVHSINGRAEETGLPAHSVDVVIAGQAFHWFDVAATSREFARILRPGGRVALFWNTRRSNGTPFLEGYEQLLDRFGTDYREVNHRRVNTEVLQAFFRGPWHTRRFTQEQPLDFDGLRGRLLSSSYVPGPEDPNFEPMLASLRALFDATAKDGLGRIVYDTELFFGELDDGGSAVQRL